VSYLVKIVTCVEEKNYYFSSIFFYNPYSFEVKEVALLWMDAVIETL